MTVIVLGLPSQMVKSTVQTKISPKLPRSTPSVTVTGQYLTATGQCCFVGLEHRLLRCATNHTFPFYFFVLSQALATLCRHPSSIFSLSLSFIQAVRERCIDPDRFLGFICFCCSACASASLAMSSSSSLLRILFAFCGFIQWEDSTSRATWQGG